MHAFRCITLLALIAAVSACGLLQRKLHGHGLADRHVDHRHHLHHHNPRGGGGTCYKPGNAGYSLDGLAQLSLGFHHKLKIVRHLFGYYGKRKIATKLDDGLETILNVSRGISVLLNEFIPGLGTYFQRLIMGSVRYIFCVLGSPWEGGSFFDRILKKRAPQPCVCKKQFGIKWGWRKYLRGYGSYDEVAEYYHLRTARSDMERILSDAGININSLKGSKKLIIDMVTKISIKVSQGADQWCRNDFIIICRYLITIVAAYGRTYKEGIGYAIVEQFTAYMNVALKQAGFDQDLSQYVEEIKIELKNCDRDSFRGIIFIDGGNDNNNNDDNQNGDNKNNGNENNGNESSTDVTTVESKTDSNSNANSNAKESSKNEYENSSGSEVSGKTTTTIEYIEVWYDEDGNVIENPTKDMKCDE